MTTLSGHPNTDNTVSDGFDVNPFGSQQTPGKLEFYTPARKNISKMAATSQNLIRWMLYVFNFVFLLFGLALIGTGAVAKIWYSKYFSFLDAGYTSVPSFMIFIGLLIAVVCFFGCCGSLRNTPWMMLTFLVLLGVLFIFEVSGAIAAYVERNKIEDYLEQKMQLSLEDYSVTNDESMYAMNHAQETLDCCGVLSYKDWWVANTTSVVPQSCCKTGKCDTSPVSLSTCAPVTKPECPIFVKGCMAILREKVEKQMGAIGGTALAIAFLQLIGMALAFVYWRRMQSGYTYAS